MTVRHERLEEIRSDRRDLFNLERLQQGLGRGGLDAAVASSVVNVTYTGGSYIAFPTLLTFVATAADGRQGVVINEADAHYFREYSWIDDVRAYRFQPSTWDANREATRLLAELLADLGVARGAVGIERTHLPVAYHGLLREALPGASLANAGDAFAYARLVKTPGEIEVFRCAACYTARAMHTGLTLARPEDSEKDVAAAMQGQVLHLGADLLDHADVHAGEHSLIVHAWPCSKRFERGELIHVDFGAVFGGYTTDLARNAVVGEPTDKQRDYYRRMWEAQQDMLARTKPGVSAGELYEFGQEAFAKVGLEYPWGTMGHSTGLEIHEGFEIARGAAQVLEPDMLVNIEPSHIERGEARYHLEDTVRVTGDGVEVLSDFGARDYLLVIR